MLAVFVENKMDPKSRFWDKVNKSGPTSSHMDSQCWEWVAGYSPDGYGKFKLNGHTWRAHRLVYIWEIDAIPHGLLVLHKCDNIKCVRPSHLYAGTTSDNMKDRAKRSSFIPSLPIYTRDTHPRTKLTREKIGEVCSLYATEGYTTRQLGIIFGVDASTIARALRQYSTLTKGFNKGSKNHRSKLTEETAERAKLLYATGKFTQAEVGAMFNVNRSTISYLTRGKTWMG